MDTRLTIDLLCGHQAAECVALADWARESLADYTDDVAISGIPPSVRAWTDRHATARRRANRAERLGYEVNPIQPREFYEDRVAINRSTPNRQGRPMTAGYMELQPTDSVLPPRTCRLHHTTCYGVVSPDGHLVAYSTFYRVGELVWLSMFLGHAAHLDNGIMYLLWREMLRDQIGCAGGIVFYNRWNSGTDGLRWFKEKVGLGKMSVTWTA